MGVNSLPKIVTRQRRGRDLNPGPTAPESSTLTTRLPGHPNSLRNKISPCHVDRRKYCQLKLGDITQRRLHAG